MSTINHREPGEFGDGATMRSANDLTRPIMGIENRTPAEVFAIMVARIEGAGVVPFGVQPDQREPINGIISAWMPEQDPHRLAVLGKLAEECNELAGRAVRCIIQGIDEKDPATGRTNREELAREASDVEACLEMLEARMLVSRITSRVADKYDGFKRWHGLIDAAPKTARFDAGDVRGTSGETQDRT